MEEACQEKNERIAGCEKQHQRNDEGEESRPERILWPLPPENTDERFEMEVYARFMRHLRYVPCGRPEIKVLSSIHFVADLLGCSDAHIAKILVDLGLRAPRIAFPSCFLDFTDIALSRKDWELGTAGPGLKELKTHWESLGEDKIFTRYEFIHTLIVQDDFCSHA